MPRRGRCQIRMEAKIVIKLITVKLKSRKNQNKSSWESAITVNAKMAFLSFIIPVICYNPSRKLNNL